MTVDISAIMDAGLVRQGPLVAVVGPTPPAPDAVYNYAPKVMLVGAGQHRVVHHDGDCGVPAGGFLIYRPGSWHLATEAGPRRYASLIVSGDRLRFFGRDQPRRQGPGETRVELRRRPVDPALDHLLAALAACRDDDPALAELGRALLRHCRPLLAQPEAGTAPTWLAIRTHIETYVHRPLSRDAVAAACGISPGHLSALCRQHTGRRFIDLLTEARMRHAEHLLRVRGMTVSAVATALGYADLRHFRRVFKRALGLPPGAVSAH
jgi:AraC-like DNA-binding protein